MSETYVKTFTDPDEAVAEAAGLEWLAEATDAGGTRVARVVGRPRPTVLELEFVSDTAPTAADDASDVDAFPAAPIDTGSADAADAPATEAPAADN